MASSRKPASRPDRSAEGRQDLLDRVAGALDAAPTPPTLGIAIAFSGGRDSTVLLDVLARLRDAGVDGLEPLVAIHVHHGLQVAADDWASHCARACAARGVDFELRLAGDRVAAAEADRGRGLEDAARQARYVALGAAARAAGVGRLVTAHHRDDRIETFLLQWLRGAGPDGLAGLARTRPLDRRDPGSPQLVRPLLDVDRDELAAYAAEGGLTWIEDPSNQSRDLARNAIRHEVLPQLERIRTGYRGATARAIDLIADAAALLQEVAAEDLARCLRADGLALDALRELGPMRQAAVLRAWLAGQGIEAPSRARIDEALRRCARPGSAPVQRFDLGGIGLERERERLRLAPI